MLFFEVTRPQSSGSSGSTPLISGAPGLTVAVADRDEDASPYTFTPGSDVIRIGATDQTPCVVFLNAVDLTAISVTWEGSVAPVGRDGIALPGTAVTLDQAGGLDDAWFVFIPAGGDVDLTAIGQTVVRRVSAGNYIGAIQEWPESRGRLALYERTTRGETGLLHVRRNAVARLTVDLDFNNHAAQADAALMRTLSDLDAPFMVLPLDRGVSRGSEWQQPDVCRRMLVSKFEGFEGHGGVSSLGPTGKISFAEAVGQAVSVPISGAPPSAPTNLIAGGATNTTLGVAWGASAGATSYELQIDDDAGFASPRTISGISGTTQIVEGLVPGTTYVVRVRAISSAGPSVFSGVVAEATTAAPDVPAGVMSALSTGAITFSWAAASLAVSYQTRVAATRAGLAAATPLLTSGLSREVGGLAVGATRFFDVRSISATGEASDFSSPISATTAADPLPGIPGILQPVRTAADEAQFTWTAGVGATSYDIRIADTAAGLATATIQTRGPALIFTTAPLAPGDERFFQVRSRNAQGPSDFTTAVSVTIPQPASGVLYMVGGGNNLLYTVDITTSIAARVGALVNFGLAGAVVDVRGLAYDAANAVIYMVGDAGNLLYAVDPTTSVATRVGNATNFGVGETAPEGLAYDAANAVLYMLGDAGNLLYTVDTTTSIATRVGNATAFGIVESAPRGLAYDAANAVLYMVGAGNNLLYTVDTTTSIATRVGNATAFGIGEGAPEGIAYDAANDVLYMVGAGNNLLYTVDTTTSIATPVGNATDFGIGEGAPEDIAYDPGTAPTVPGTPTGLAATASASSIRFDWNAVSAATSYDVITAPTLAGLATATPQSVTATTFNAPGLMPSETVFCQVRARNSAGVSNYATAVSATTPAVSALAVPANFRVDMSRPDRLLASWTTVAGAANYDVRYDTNAAFSSPDIVTRDAAGGAIFVPGLTPSTEYFLQVRARSSSQTSDWSGTVSQTTEAAAAAPGLPGIPTFTAGPNSLTFMWAAGSGADTYEVRDAASETALANAVTRSVGASRTETLQGLGSSVTRFFQVRSRNAEGASDYTTPVSATTQAEAPPPVPTGLALGSVTSEGFIASWAASAGAAEYRIQVSTSSTFATTVLDDTTTSTSRSVTGLTPRTEYFVRVRAISATGVMSNYTARVSETTGAPAIPDVPTGLSDFDVSSSGFTVAWFAAAEAATYDLQVGTDVNFTTPLVLDVETPNRTRVLSNLTPGQLYYVRVRSSSSTGVKSAYTNPLQVRTDGPLAPANLRSSAITNDSFNVLWNASSGATSYQIQVDNNSTFTSPLLDTTTTGLSRAVTSGLAASTDYFVRVRAIAATGVAGSYTTALTVRTAAPFAPTREGSVTPAFVSLPDPNGQSSLTFNHVVAQGTELLVVAVGMRRNNPANVPQVTGIRYGGRAMTRRVRETNVGTNAATADIYTLTNPTPGQNSVVVSVSTIVNTIMAVADNLSNVRTAAPVGDTATVSGPAAQTLTLSTTGPYRAVGIYVTTALNASITPNSQTNDLAVIRPGNPGTAAYYDRVDTNGGSTNVGASSADDGSNYVGCAITIRGR